MLQVLLTQEAMPTSELWMDHTGRAVLQVFPSIRITSTLYITTLTGDGITIAMMLLDYPCFNLVAIFHIITKTYRRVNTYYPVSGETRSGVRKDQVSNYMGSLVDVEVISLLIHVCLRMDCPFSQPRTRSHSYISSMPSYNTWLKSQFIKNHFHLIFILLQLILAVTTIHPLTLLIWS